MGFLGGVIVVFFILSFIVCLWTVAWGDVLTVVPNKQSLLERLKTLTIHPANRGISYEYFREMDSPD